MGFKWEIGRGAIGLGLLTAAAGGNAAPRGEPLVVTRLPEAELRVVALNDPEAQLADEEVQRFAKAISQATLAEQQAFAARCRSSDPVPAAGAGRLAWEANCRYQRR